MTTVCSAENRLFQPVAKPKQNDAGRRINTIKKLCFIAIGACALSLVMPANVVAARIVALTRFAIQH
jgi:hypothetical protein